ncbi:MAG TPA: potassium-transporting ATPase subunit KdpA [Candidatus Baltobacteraceae bacterium]|jgi:K+-transporting ATPase ATPase A chain|nr:potassium-transporting ATPase subunit KdpA [Candidatus Baltobacteraceae bacterium]
MTPYAVGQAIIFFAVFALLVKPLGDYMALVFAGERTPLSILFRPIESALYRFCRIDPDEEMRWTTYAGSVLAFGLVSGAAMYLLLRTQQWLPFNPQHFGNLAPDLAWNTAASFITTTDWQFYSGESALSYLSQMAGCGWQNFAAAGTGLAVAIAFLRGLTRANKTTLGNFWVDLTRALLYVLLPISLIGGLVLCSQGVPQNVNPYVNATSPEGFAQTITGGPMASQEIISLLGGNGGGFVAANASSPNENPTPFSNLLLLLAMFFIPGALTRTFGKMANNVRQGWMIFAAMTLLFVLGLGISQFAEAAGNPLIHALGVAGGNMEGKEVRFGSDGAGLSLTVATDSGAGASNFAYDSLSPIGGLIALINMQIGEIIFGGVGSGLYGMLILAVLTVFIAGLMVGRTPEFLGKKIERREIQYVILAVLAVPFVVLVPASIAVLTPAGLATLGNAGSHGFSEIIYAFSSTAVGNGSAFGGLGSNTFYNIVLGLVMLAGRYLPLIPALALAGAFAGQPVRPVTSGTFKTDSVLFTLLLIGVILIDSALIFMPADILGPIAEQLLLTAGKTF